MAEHPLYDPRSHIMDQGDYWIDRDLRRHELREMDADYLVNVLGFLRYWDRELYGDHVLVRASDELMGQWDLMDESAREKTVRAWLLGTTLYRAIEAELFAGVSERRQEPSQP